MKRVKRQIRPKNSITFPEQRWCVVNRRRRLDTAAIRREILRHEDVCGQFTLPATPAPARDQTLFKVYTDGQELLIAVAVFESVAPTLRHGPYGMHPLPNRNRVELFFAPWNDDLGWVQFGFPPDGNVEFYCHTPYPEALSTSFAPPRLKRSTWEQDTRSRSHRLYWLFAWFDVVDIFRNGKTCGFNVSRYCPPVEEISSWNHAAAVGFQDATTFGKLTLAKVPVRKSRPISFRPPTRRQARDFRLSVTYDIPDNIAYTHHYTPQLIEREMETWKSWGIDRICWIDYGPMSDWPSFWRMMAGPRNRDPQSVERTRRACDDLLPVVAKACKKLGLEVFAVYKPFDLGFNNFWMDGDDGISCVREIENRYASAHPDVAAHPELTMRANPAWLRRTTFPIRRLCLYSQTPIERFTANGLTIWISKDNRRFEKYAGPRELTVGSVSRPHFTWTPAGKVAETSPRTRDWCIELSNLSIKVPFVAIEIADKGFTMTHRHFAFVEAFSGVGTEVPVEPATGGTRAGGFEFGKRWTGWANHNEPAIDPFTWAGPELGLRFGEIENITTLLEPTYPGTRQIWLRHLQRILDAGVDGIDIRTIGHHNCTNSYLTFAFADPVRQEFQRRFGHDVEPTDADYQSVRRIRGDAYTQFVRDAAALVRSRGKRLAAHVEWGADVPPHLHARLQMQMELQWERWIRQRLVDELSLRGWGCFNRYVHGRLLPLARRHDVKVHLISTNLTGGIDLRAMELCDRLVTEACAAGFSGYNLYESDCLLRLNSEGHPMSVGLTAHALQLAKETLSRRVRDRSWSLSRES